MSNAFRDYFTRRSPASGRALLGVWLASYLTASTPGLALPQDGQVTHGSGSIDRTSARSMEIRQASERMAASFSSFDIAAQEAVNVSQPGSGSVFLGNISGESATTIFGTLTANGSVMLVNPRGVVFGKGSRVDTASLIASSLGVDVDDFMAGALELEFSADMAGRIVNRGVIQAAKGGSVTLMGDEVINEGLIVAEMGRVDLASGSEAVLTFDRDRLIGLEVTKSALGDLGGESAVLNSGTIEADGGQIFLSADAARDLFSRAVQNEGILRANRAEEVNGEIVLSSTGDTWNPGRIEATADSGRGGSVQVLGDRVGVSGEIDASGAEGGGEILVGGDYQGKGETRTAKKTWVGSDAELKADATEEGDGGRVIVWADDATRFFGSLSARGGDQGGDGGFAEVSGKQVLEYRGTADLTATSGDRGTLLLDPVSISIEGGNGDGAADGSDAFEGDASATPGSVAFTDVSPTTVFESELEAQSATADIVLQATDSISATGTFVGDDLTLATDSNLTLETRNAAGDAIGGINLTGSTAGNDLLVRTQGTGSISITAGTDGVQASNLVLPKLQSDTSTIDLNASNSVFLRGGISTNGADVSVNAAADISLDVGTGADIDTAGGVGGAITLSPGTGVVRTPGDGAFLVTDGGAVDIAGNLFINGGMTIDTDGGSGFAAESGNAAGDVTIGGAVSGDGSDNDTLAIDATGTAGSGAVSVTGGIGTVTVAGGNDVYSVQFEGDAVAVGEIETSNTVDGQFIDLTGSSGITLTGSNYSVAGVAGGAADTITINGPITLESDAILTGAGEAADSVTLAGTIDGDAAASDRTLTISAGAADLDLGDGIGQTEALGSLSITDAGIVTLGGDVTTRGGISFNAAVNSAGSRVFSADANADGVGSFEIDTSGSLAAPGIDLTAADLVLTPTAATTLDAGANTVSIADSTGGIGLGAGVGGMNLSSAELDAITAANLDITSGNTITIDGIADAGDNVSGVLDIRATGTGTLTVSGAPSRFTAGEASVRADQGLSIAADLASANALTVDGDADDASGGDVSVDADVALSAEGGALTLASASVALGASSLTARASGDLGLDASVSAENDGFVQSVAFQADYDFAGGDAVEDNIGSLSITAPDFVFANGPEAVDSLTLTGQDISFNGTTSYRLSDTGVITDFTVTAQGNLEFGDAFTNSGASVGDFLVSFGQQDAGATADLSGLEGTNGSVATLSVTAGGGTDVLVVPDVNSTVTLTGTGAGSFGPFDFTAVEQVTATSGSAILTGTGGGDVFDLASANSGSVTGLIDFAGFSDLRGSGGTDTLQLLDSGNTVNVTANDAGSVDGGATLFSSMESVVGGIGADDFVYDDGATLSSVDGGTGTDSIDFGAYSTGLNVNITATDGGSGVGTFASIETFIASSQADTFTFNDGVDFTGTLNGNGGADSFDYSAWTTALDITLPITEGTVAGGAGDDVFTQTGAFTGTLDGGGGDDTLNVTDLSTAGSFIFNGGGNDAGGDVLNIDDAGFVVTDAVYSFTNANDGQIDLDGTVLAFTGLEPITDNTDAANRVFTFNGGTETITLDDDGVAANDMSFIDSTAGESVTFTNPTASLTINAGTGDDTVDLNALDANAVHALVVNGDDGIDTVDLGTGLPATLGDLTVGGASDVETVTIPDTGLVLDSNVSLAALTDLTNASAGRTLIFDVGGLTVDSAGTDTTFTLTDVSGGSGNADLSLTGAADVSGTVAGTLAISAGGITQTGSLSAGATTLAAAGNPVTLTSTNNVLGDLTVTGGMVSITEADAITDGGAWSAGATTLDAQANAITLDNASSDFTGALSLQNAGANNISVTDVNALVLGDVDAGQNLLLTAGGNVTGTTEVNVGGATTFGTTADISLTNAVNTFTGAVTFAQDPTNLTLVDDTALELASGLSTGTLSITAAGITQAGQVGASGATSLDAAGNAITLTNANNAFGDLTVTGGAVQVTETDGTQFAGTSSADTLVIDSGGALTNAASASVTVTDNADLTGTSITLGNQTGDLLDFGSLTLNSVGAVALAEDSATVLSGLGTVDSLDLDSTGSISDDGTADLTVTNLADFAGTSLLLDDTYDVGSFALTASGTSLFTETNGFTIAGIDVGANTITLDITAGAVDQTGDISAATLDLDGAATYSLTRAGNAVATLDADTSLLAGLSYTDADGFDVAGIDVGANTATLRSASGTGTVTQSASINAGTLVLDGAAGTIWNLGLTNDVNSLEIANATLGGLEFVDSDDVAVTSASSSGNLSIAAIALGIGSGATLETTQGGNLTLAGDVVLGGAGAATLSTDGTTDGDLSINGTVSGAGDDDDLALDAGSGGSISVGAFTGLADFSIADAASATVSGASDALSVTLAGTTGGTYAFDGALAVDDLNANAGTYDLALNGGGTVTSSFTPVNTGTVGLTDVSLLGGADFSAVATEFGGGTLDFDGNTTFGVVTLTDSTAVDGTGVALNFNGAMDDDNDPNTASGLTVTTDMTVAFNAGAAIGSNGVIDSFTANGTGTVLMSNGTLNVAGNTTTFNTALVLGADMTVTDAGGGTDLNPLIAFNNTVDSSAGNSFQLTVDANDGTTNAGTILFDGVVGGTESLSNLVITRSAGVSLNQAVTLDGTFQVLDSTGLVDFAGVLTANSVAGVAGGGGYRMLFQQAPAITGTGSFASAGGVEFDASGSFGGGITVSGGTTTLAGALSTTNSAIDLQTATVLDGDASLASGTGAIDLAAIDDNADGGTGSNLTITSDDRVTFAGAIGTTPIDSLTVSEATPGAGTAFAEFNGAGTVTASGGTLTFNTPVVVLTNTTFTDTGATGISFDSTVDGPAGVEVDVVGPVAFNDVVGGATALDFLTVTNSSDTNFAATVDVADVVTLTNTANTVRFRDVLTANRIFADAGAFTVDFDAAPAIGAGGGDFDNTVNVNFDAGGSFAGGVDFDAATPVSLTGTLSTSGTPLTLGNTLTLTGNATLVAGAGAISTQAVTDGGNGFALDLQSAASTGAVTVNGPLTVGALNTFGGNYAVSLLDGGSVTSLVEFLNAGTVTLGDDAGDSLTFDGGLETTGNASNPSSTSIAGDVQTSADPITLGAVTLGDAAALTTAGGALTIASITNGNLNPLDLDAGAASIGVTGSIANLGDLQVVNSNGTSFGGPVDAGAVTLTNTTGTIAFQDILAADSVTALGGAVGFDVRFDAEPDVTGAGSFANAGGVTFADGALFDGGLTVSGGTTTAQGVIATRNSVIDLGALDLSANTTLDSAGGDITTGAVASGGSRLRLDADATGAVTLASFADLGDLTLVDSGGATFAGAVDAGTVTLSDTSGTIAFQGSTDIITGLVTAARPYSVSFTGTVNSVAGTTSFANTGDLTLGGGVGDSITFTGGVDTTSAANTFAAGTVATGDSAMTLGDLTLNADSALESGSGTIDVASATDAGNGFTLTLQDNTPGSTGAVTFAGDVSVGTLATFAQDYDVSLLGGGTIDTATTFNNIGAVTLGDAAGDDLTFTGGLTVTDAEGGIFTGGIVSTTDSALTLGNLAGAGSADTVTLNANTTFSSGSGAIALADVTDAANSFTLTLQEDLAASTGTATVGGALTVNALQTFNQAYDVALLGGGELVADTNFANAGAVTIGDDAGDIFDFDGGLDTRGNPTALDLAGTIRTDSRPMDLRNATLTANTTLASGSSTISGGSVTDGGADRVLTLQENLATSTGTVSFGGAVTVEDLVTFGQGYSVALLGNGTSIDQAVDFLNTGTVTLGDGGTGTDALTFNGGVATTGNATNPTETRVAARIETAGATDLVLGPLSLLADSALDSADGDLTIRQVTGNAGGTPRALSLDAGAGQISGTSIAGVSTLTVVDAEDSAPGALDALGFSGSVATTTAVELNGVDVTNGANYRFGGAVTTPTLSTNQANDGRNAFSLELVGGLALANAANFDHAGALAIGAAGVTSTFNGGFDTTAVGGLVTLAGNIVSPTGLTLNDLSLTADTTLDSAGAALTVGNVSSNGFALALDGGAAGTVSLTSLADTGDLTVTDSGSTTFTGAVDANTITLTDTTGTIAFQGNTTAATGLVTAGQPYSVSFNGTTNSIAGSTTFLNTGSVTLGNGGDATTFDGGVTATAPGTINLDGTVAVNSGAITLGDGDSTLEVLDTTTIGGASLGDINLGVANLADDVSLTVGTGIANRITIAGVLGTADGATSTESLEIDTTGTATFTGAVGAADGSNNLGQLTITRSGGTIFQSSVDAGTVTLTDTIGTIAFQGDTTIGTALNTAANGYSVALIGANNSVAGATTFANTGAVTLGNDLNDSIEFTGGIDTTGAGPSGTNVAGTVTTGLGVGQDIVLNDTLLTANTTLNAGDGLVTLASVTDGGTGFGLTLQEAGATGAVSIGGFTLGSLTTKAGAYAVSLLNSGTVTGDTNFNNTVSVTLGNDGQATDLLELLGGLDTTGVTDTFVAADLRTSGTQMDLGAVTLNDTSTLRSGAGAINVRSVAGSGQTLNLQQAGASGDVSFAEASTFGILNTASGAYGIAFNSGMAGTTTTIESGTTFGNTTEVAFGNETGDTVVVQGALDTATSVARTRLAGSLSTTGGFDLSLGASGLDADAGLDSADGVLSLGAVTGNPTGTAHALSLDAGAGRISGSSIAGVSTLTVVDAEDSAAGAGDALALTGPVTATTAVDLNGAAGADGATYAFGGALTTPTLTTNQGDDDNDAFSLALNGGVSVTNAVTFGQSGSLTLGDDGDVSAFAGGVIATAPSAVNVDGTVSAAGTGLISLGDVDTAVSVSGTSLIGGTSSGQISLGSVALTDGAALTIGTGAATPLALAGVQGTGDGASERLTLNTTAAATVTGALDSTPDAGGENNLDELVITQSGGVRFQGTVDAEKVTLTDTSAGAAIDFASDVDIDTGLTVQPGTGDYDLRLRGSTMTIAGTTTFRNGGVLDLGDAAGDSLTFDTGVIATEPATIHLNGAVGVNTGDITLGDGDTRLNVPSTTTLASPDGTISVGVANLADDVTLTLGNGGSNLIDIAGATGTDDDGATAEAVEVNTTGDVAVTGAIGTDANTLDALTITQSGSTTFASTVDAETVTLADTTGAIRFVDDLTATTLNTAAQGYAVELPGGVSITDATTFLNTGGVRLGDEAGDVSRFVGGLDTTAAGTTDLAGTVRTTDTALTLGAVNLNGATTLVSGSGALTVAGIAGGNQALTLQEAASTGAVTIAGTLDNLGSLTSAGGAFDLALQSGGSVAGATTLQNTGTSELGDEATDAFSFNGGLVATAGMTSLFGSFDTSNTDALLGVTSLAGATSIDAGVGDLTLGATTGNGNDWTLTADALTLGSLAGGGAVRLVDIVSSTVTNDFAAASLEIAGVEAAAFGGNLSTTGALELQDLGSLDVAGDTRAGSLTSNASGSMLNFGGATRIGGALSLNDGAAATFSGALAAGSFTSGATGLSIDLNGAVNVSGSTNLQNTGGLGLGDDGDAQIFAGGLTATGSEVSLFADVQTRDAAVALANVSQTGAGSIRTTGGGSGGGAAITLGAVEAGGFALELAGGTGGDISVDSIAGAGTTSFVSADKVTVDGGLQATTAVFGDANTFAVGGALDLGTLDTSGAGSAGITFTGGGSVDADTTFANTGGVRLGDGDGDRFLFGGGLDTTAGSTTLNADVATDSGRIDVQALTIAGDSTLDATNGGDPGTEGAAVVLAGAVTGSNGSESLNLRGGTGPATAMAGVSGIGSFFVRSGSDLTLGEVSTNGNSIRGIVSGDVALQGNLTDATGDISIVTTGGTLEQADDTLILAQQGDVHLAAFNRMRVFDVRSEQGSILLALLDPSANPATPRVIERGHVSGDFSTDLTAPNGVVAVISGGKSDFGSSDNGFRIEASRQFVNLNTGSSFIDQSNAAPLTVLPSAQASRFQQVFEQNTAERLPELGVEAALIARLSAAITNPANTVESASRATTIESQVLTQQSEEEESLSSLSEDVFIDITLVNAEQQPLCLPESLQGFDSVGCDGQEAVAMWMERLGLQLVAMTRDGEEPVLARMPLPRPGAPMFRTAGGGH